MQTLVMEIDRVFAEVQNIRDQRNKQHQQHTVYERTEGFDQIASIWTALLQARMSVSNESGCIDEVYVTGEMVQLFMAALKLWRVAMRMSVEDSCLDAINYTAFIYEAHQLRNSNAETNTNDSDETDGSPTL